MVSLMWLEPQTVQTVETPGGSSKQGWRQRRMTARSCPGEGEIADAAGLSIRELLAVAEAECPDTLGTLLPSLDRLVALIRARAARDGAPDPGGAHGEEGVGDRENEPTWGGVLCSRCVKVLQRDRLRAYEQANDQCAMRYVRWFGRACAACAGSCARLASTESLPARLSVLQSGGK